MSGREYLNKMIEGGITLKEIPVDKLLWLMSGDASGSFTSQMYYEIEQEYIRRLHSGKDRE